MGPFIYLSRPNVRQHGVAGRTQLESPEWNRLGYGNNSIQEVPVCVR